MKDLKERLEKINSCSDISSDASSSCENPNIFAEPISGRRSGKMLEMIEFLSKSFPETERERPKVLIIGASEGGELMKHQLLFIEALKNANVEIVYISSAIGSVGKLEMYKDDFKNFNHSFSFEGRSLGRSDRDIENLRKLLTIDSIPEKIEDYSFLRDNFKYHDRKIPIKGKSSKKGKNNPQCGSNFHK